MDLILASLPLLVNGLVVTFKIAAITLLCSTILSAIFGIMAVARFSLLRWFALVYVELFRDIPLIVNLLFVYFGAPLIGVALGPFSASIVSLSTWGGANGAEIVRGGFNSIPKHQRESCLALGLKPWEAMVYVLLPQIILPIIPPFTGLFSLVVQATSLASLIGARELFRTSQIIVERTTMMTGYSPAFTVYGFVLLVYLAICLTIALLTRVLETRLTERATRRGLRVAKLDQSAAESV